MKIFHPSLECVQHGGKPLVSDDPKVESVLAYAKKIGCTGVQLSHFHLLEPDGNSFVSADTVRSALDEHGLRLDGISAHCLTWVHGSAWTGTPSVGKFISESMQGSPPKAIAEWSERMILELMSLSTELSNRAIQMFWGMYWGLEVASGYPWGMWEGLGDRDLVKEGDDRFLSTTAAIRKAANEVGIAFGHEIHPGTGMICGEDFMDVVKLADNDPCIAVNADPSHCWEGEGVEERFRLVGPHIVGCHVKDNYCVPGRSRRSMRPDWKGRGMFFTPLGEGQIDLRRYVQQMIEVGYPARFRKLQGLASDATVPLVGEAESAFTPLDETSADATAYIRDNFCGDYAEGSFEDAMAA